MDTSVEFPPFALRDYALIADGERGALIGPRGDIAWLCAPAWDSDAVFSNLVGGGGCYAVTPHGRYTWGGYYDPRSLIWNSRWVTDTGTVECREALAQPADGGVTVLLRRIRVLDGTARMRVLLDVRAGFGAERMVRTHRDDHGIWTGHSGPISFRWSGAPGASRPRDKPLAVELTLAAGQVHDLVLELAVGRLETEPVSAAVAWDDTEDSWRDAVPQLGDGVIGARDAELAIAVLSGLDERGRRHDRGGHDESAGAGPKPAATTTTATPGSATSATAGRPRPRTACHRLLDSAVQFVSERLLAGRTRSSNRPTPSGEARSPRNDP